MENKNGPIDVNGDVTPITKQPIEQVDASSWPELSLSDLYDQRTALQTRINMVYANSGHPDTIIQMKRGLASIDYFISQKNNQSENSVNNISSSNNYGGML